MPELIDAGDGASLARLTSALGLFGILALAWVSSEAPRHVRWRPVVWGVGLQLGLGLVLLAPGVAEVFYTVVDGAVQRLLAFSDEGARFVFNTIEPHYVQMPGEEEPTFIVGQISPPLRTFAFSVLPTIIFFSALSSILYHVGLMQALVRGIAGLMVRTLGTSGAESLSAAGNIFVGQTEAPLLVRPFIATMTRSELMAVMTGGFATVAGGVLGAYVSFLGDIPNIAGHLVLASIMSAPAAIVCAKLMVPETQVPKTARGASIDLDLSSPSSNVLEAATVGASDGMKLALNVAAMLIAIVGLVAMVNWGVGLLPVTECEGAFAMGYGCAGGPGVPLSLSTVFGWVFSPLAFLMGIPWSECDEVGRLLGEKIVLTEFLAYMHLADMMNQPNSPLSPRSAVIASYALCGFANFASIGIQLGGIGGMAPERLGDLASLGLRAMWGGMLAACMTGAVAGIML